MKVKVERTTKKPAIQKAEDPERDREDQEDGDHDHDQENLAEEELDFLPADLTAAISTATTTKIATTAATPTSAVMRNLIVSAILYLYTPYTG